jgi:hypothetical protein
MQWVHLPLQALAGVAGGPPLGRTLTGWARFALGRPADGCCLSESAE